jgi:Flp pilus assembly pilin Flp
MKEVFKRFIHEDQGQDLIEYVLIATFVSVGALLGAGALGTALNGWYDDGATWVNDNGNFTDPTP